MYRRIRHLAAFHHPPMALLKSSAYRIRNVEIPIKKRRREMSLFKFLKVARSAK